MRILIDLDEDKPTPTGVDLHFRVDKSPMGHKAHVAHEAENLPPKRDLRQVISAVLYGY